MVLTANVIRGLTGGIAATNISSGVLPVERGGTGVQSSVGSGNVVLSDDPTFQGSVNINGNLYGSYIYGNGSH
jgi:autotransporter-associated beta strand protein